MRIETANDPVGFASLVPHETTVHSPLTEPCGDGEHGYGLDIAFRHSGWLADRERVRLALVACEIAPPRVERFVRCGADAWLQRSNEHADRYRISANYCHDRFCVPCAVARGRLIAARICEWLGNQPARFITLTLAADLLPLADRLDRLYGAFRKLRRSGWWRDCCPDGLATVEIKWNVKSANWHPHLHILCRSSYVAQDQLSLEWHKATGDSYIVDVRLVNSPGEVANYVSKYIAKPGSNSVYRIPDRLQEMIRALHGRRLLLCFGNCKLPDDPEDLDTDTWENIGPLSRILFLANQGDAEAVALVASFQKGNPCTTTNHPPPDLGYRQRPHPQIRSSVALGG